MDKKFIELAKSRDFGTAIGDSFTFFLRNLGPLGLLFLYYVVPVFMVGAVLFGILGKSFFNIFNVMAQSGAGAELSEDALWSFGTGITLLYGFMALSVFMTMLSVSAYMKSYQENQGEVDMSAIWPMISKNLGRVAAYWLLLILGVIIISGLVFGIGAQISMGLAGFLAVVLGFGGVYFFTTVKTGHFIMMNEDVGIGEALKRSFFLIKDRWWWFFLVSLILGFIVGIIQYIFIIPFYIVLFAQMLGATEVGTINMEMGFWGSFTFLFAMLGGLFLAQLRIILINLGYYKFVEEKEGRQLSKQIEKIGEIEDKNFGNEGEF